MYNGWQGYGNPEGVRIDFAPEDSSSRAKREREDGGAEDQAFKHSRIVGGSVMGFGQPGGLQGQHHLGQARPGEGAYDPLQPGLGPELGQGHAQHGGFVSHQASQPLNSFGQGAGLQQNKPGGFLGQQHAQPAANGVPASQGYHPSSSGPPGSFQSFNLPSRDAQQQQQRAGSQQTFGQQQGAQPNFPQQYQQSQLHSQQQPQQAPPQQQHQVNQGGGFQQPQGFGSAPFDPRLQQQAPSASQQQQQQQPPPAFQLPTQLLPQQMASLADVLGPLLQQTQAGTGPSPGQAGDQPQNGPQLGAAVEQLQQHFGAQQQPFPVQQQQQPQIPQQQQAQPQLQAMQLPPIQHPPGVLPKQEGFQAEPLPADAAQTLYVDGMPLDVTKREMSHIFRPFEGYKEIRIVEKKDKHGNPLVLSFVEFETPLQAHAALKTIQGYPMDPATPTEGNLRVCFAKPFKPNDPRSRGVAGLPQSRMQPAGEAHGRVDRRDDFSAQGQRGGRDAKMDRDRRDRGGPPRRFGDRRPEDRRPAGGGERRR